jgi:hypothetical protein
MITSKQSSIGRWDTQPTGATTALQPKATKSPLPGTLSWTSIPAANILKLLKVYKEKRINTHFVRMKNGGGGELPKLQIFWAIFKQFLCNFWAIFGQFLGNFCAIFVQFLCNFLGSFWAIFGQFLGNFCNGHFVPKGKFREISYFVMVKLRD